MPGITLSKWTLCCQDHLYLLLPIIEFLKVTELIQIMPGMQFELTLL